MASRSGPPHPALSPLGRGSRLARADDAPSSAKQRAAGRMVRMRGVFSAVVARKGSRVQFKHKAKPGRVTVPYPKRDIPLGTLKSIEKQAALKLR
jgi:predicted RNA binding protein YcfA (HicA-like mRNA interferase family)